MPYIHSERLEDQEAGVDLMRHLGDPRTIAFAQQHRDIIAKLEHFPHRSMCLGRKSTAKEDEYVKRHGGFGQ